MMGEHIPTLLDQPDPAALPFRSHQDALYFASHGAEHSNRILAANNLINVVERYRKGDIELKLALYLSGVRGARKYHLVFFAVPMGIELQPRTSNLDVASNPDSSADCNGVKHFVLRGVTQFIQCPEGVIPSLVRLERFKQAADFRWQILASAGQVIPHVDFGWSEGKFCGFRIGTNVLPADRKCDLIEDGPEVISAVEHNVGELIDKAVNESELEGLTRSIEIFLDDWGPSTYLRETPYLGFQIGEMTLCMTEHALRAFEDVSHGKIRPDEKP